MLLLLLAVGMAFAQTAEELWKRDLENAKALAVELFPDVTRPESELVRRMVEIDQRWKADGDDAFYSAWKPLTLAVLADRDLRSGDSEAGKIEALRDRLAEKK